ncbi:serine/threonine-protein kinase [Streptomyces sp. NPDC001982]|uniref:serine/threonine-protein kinase n=1 Tax=Streptomyces sp. NPDC001982 TaxID=3154405 RepID=UPI00331BC916
MQPLAPEDPARIGPYRLLSRLGAGGMGRVYLARRDDGDDSDVPASPTSMAVAVKLIRTDPDARHDEFRRRFAREVAAARRVSGRWTARVLDADTDAEQPWVATEYVAGPTLRAVVRGDFGPLPSASAHVLAHRLAQALDAIHAADLVHRDLKPSNILLTAAGPRVIDFGVAHDVMADSTLTRTGSLVGTPEFMSPEQVRGERVTPAGDVFSLGSVLTYAATGRSPFQGAGEGGVHALLFRIAYEEPLLDGVPEALTDLVRRCLAKDPEERPEVAELVELTRRAPAGAWLPSALLVRLDRIAAEPVPNAPQRAETAPQETTEFPDFPEPSEPVPDRDPLDVPEAGIVPPRILRKPLSRAVHVRQRLAGGLLASVAALSVAVGGVTVWAAFAQDEPGGDEPFVVPTGDIVAAAYGETEAHAKAYLGQQSFTLHLSLYDPAKTGYVAGTPGAVCKGTFGEVAVKPDGVELRRPSRSVILPEGAPNSVCPELGTIRLELADPDVVWITQRHWGTPLELGGRPGDSVPSSFIGTRAFRSWTVSVRKGAIGEPLVTGTRTSSGRHCTWKAVVLDAGSVLRTTSPVLDAPHSDPGCTAPTAPVTLARNDVRPQPTRTG